MNKASLSPIRQWFPLALVSCVSLFLELAVIRWLSSEVRLFSYLKNIPLLATFLGLSIGYSLAGKKRLQFEMLFPLLFLFVALALAVGRVSSPRAFAYPASGEEFIWYSTPYSYWIQLIIFLGMLAIFFLLTMFLFVPLGQACGEEMNKFKPVPAYIVNIASSLVGIWLFTAICFWQVPPLVWFGVALFGLLGYFSWWKRYSPLDWVLVLLILTGLGLFNQNAIWSPYQRLSYTPLILTREDNNDPVQVGYTLNVQQVFYQRAIDLSPDFLKSMGGAIPELEDMAISYNLPYQLAGHDSRALIVGSGIGNDVAAALRNGMESVDAVEIDPAILMLGYQLHPEVPYADARVAPIVDDARSFFKKNEEKYDVVAFGLLDSHTLLSSLSSVRLDSYVYTLESFEQVREHLSPGGLVAVTFAASTPWIEERLGRMMGEVFGSEHVWFHRGAIGTTFIASLDVTSGGATSGSDGAKADKFESAGLQPWAANEEMQDLPLPTDDWPYLYMRSRKVPDAYWQALLVIGIISILILRRSFPQALRIDWQFWLLGVAFLLVEFIGITRLALLFGTTWLVNALAISGVLAMILAANLLVLWRQSRAEKLGKRHIVNLNLAYFLLLASLAMVILFPLETLNQFDPFWRALFSLLLLSLPLFFSGMIFSEMLHSTGEVTGPLASNLNGSVFGGILEYSSIWWGVQNLYILAFAVYAMAFLVHRRRKK